MCAKIEARCCCVAVSGGSFFAEVCAEVQVYRLDGIYYMCQRGRCIFELSAAAAARNLVSS